MMFKQLLQHQEDNLEDYNREHQGIMMKDIQEIYNLFKICMQ